MRMFLVGMCDIFLILYLTTMSQVSLLPKSNLLTVDDYKEAKELEALAQIETEEAKKLEALAQIEAEKAREAERLAKEKEAKAIETLTEKQKELIKLATEKSELLQIAKAAHVDIAEATKREIISELKVSEMLRNLELIKKASSEALIRAQNAEKLVTISRNKENEAILKSNEWLVQSKIAKQNETDALKLVEEAQKKAEKAQREAEEAQKRAEEALKQADASRAREADALEMAWEAQRQKDVAIGKAKESEIAKEAALQVAQTAKKEVEQVNTKIETITQTADTAFAENVNDKLVQVTVAIKFKTRWHTINNKEITLQSVPVKIGNELLIFTPLDQIGFGQLFTPDQLESFDVSVKGLPVTTIYVKGGSYKIAALVIDLDLKHTKPIDKLTKFSSYMPVLMSLRNQQPLGMFDKLRGVSMDFFIFKRDHLRLINDEELYFDNAGIRGTGNYAEYIVEGDQIVDMGGDFIGLAYKKNSILRIDNLDGWKKIPITKFKKAEHLAQYIKDVTRS